MQEIYEIIELRQGEKGRYKSFIVHMKINNIFKLVIAIAVSELAGVIGSVFTISSIRALRSLFCGWQLLAGLGRIVSLQLAREILRRNFNGNGIAPLR